MIKRILNILKKYRFTRKSLVLPGILIAASCAGFAVGYLSGAALVKNYVTGTGRMLAFLSRPGHEFIGASNMLGSGSGLDRLSGYYTLLDTSNIDAGFLIDRYRREEALYNKRTIIWILGYSGEKTAVLRFLSQEYKTVDEGFKREILRSMKRLSPDYFSGFIKDKNISDKLIDAL